MITSKIRLDQDRIAAFCRKWQISEMSLFGSVLRDDFGPDSDVDFLVTFEPGTDHDWDAWPAMLDEPAGIAGRRVDLVERRLVEQSENYIRRATSSNRRSRSMSRDDTCLLDIAVMGTRHRLVHEYMKVDLDVVWRIVEQHLPELRRLLGPLIPPEPPPAAAPHGGPP